MTNPREILALAVTQLGVHEEPPNSSNVIYNREYYGGSVNNPALDWCAVFLWWLFGQLDSAALYFGGEKTASCSTLYGYHKAQGQAVSGDYQPGDIVFFNFSGGTAPTHVGLCESWDGAQVTTIDGNTGNTLEQKGGVVLRRTRAKEYIVAAYRPQYEEEAEVTYEQFKAFAQQYLAEISAQPADAWGAEDWKTATEQGIVDGSGPMAPLLRLEYATSELRRIAQTEEAEKAETEKTTKKAETDPDAKSEAIT